MGKTLVALLRQVQEILPVLNGGTGLSTSGVDTGKFLRSDGAGGFVMATVPTQNSFNLDGGAANTSYGTMAKIDCGSSV